MLGKFWMTNTEEGKMARMIRKFWAAKTIGQAEVRIPKRYVLPEMIRKLLERLGRLGKSVVRRVRRE